MSELQEFKDEVNKCIGGLSADVRNLCDIVKEGKKERTESSKAHWDELRKMTDSISDQKVKHATLEGEVKTVKSQQGTQNKKSGVIAGVVSGIIIFLEITWDKYFK